MLLYMLLIVTVMALSAVFIMKFTMWMVARLGHKYIETTHRSAEFIVNTKEVPPFWYKEKKPYPFPLLQKYLCLRRLKKLITYFENNTIAGDEESRKIVTAGLVRAHNLWVDREWSDLYPFSRTP